MKLKMICLYFCAAVMVVGLRLEFTSGQQTVSCPRQNKGAPQYRVGYKSRFKGKELLVQISVEPKKVNRTDMIALAQRLNEDFRREQILVVAICDDYIAAQAPDLMDTLLIPPRSIAFRGFYELDRVSRKEGISFSTERGKPLDEIDIDLGRTP